MAGTKKKLNKDFEENQDKQDSEMEMPVSNNEEDFKVEEDVSQESKSRKGRKRKNFEKGKNKAGKDSKKKGKKSKGMQSEMNESSKDEEINETQHSTMVIFNEEENVIQMRVIDQSEFPSDKEGVTELPEVQDSSEEEEGEISFNNNASVARKTESLQPCTSRSGMNERSKKELEEERENRIISKTVAKLQEIMMAGGYFNTVVSNQEITKSASAGKDSSAVSGNEKNGKMVKPKNSNKSGMNKVVIQNKLA